MRLFTREKYEQRRTALVGQLTSGLVWIMGNGESAANYKDNTFPFRQNSNFLYYFGINAPDLHATIDIETGEAILYGHELTMDDIIWMGEIEKLSGLGLKVGVTT
nr:aminopeptidase P N-terminal domain-containing protein [Saprospiraceae bacterium]